MISVVFAVLFSTMTLAADENIFQLKPYLYSIRGEQLALTWSYKTPLKELPKIEIFYNDLNIAELNPIESENIYTSILPINSCGSGFSYKVSGLEKNISIENKTCEKSQEKTKFVFISDTQEFPEQTQVMAKNISRHDPQFVLHGGDFVQKGADENQWVEMFNALSDVLSQSPLVPAIGNHEYRRDSKVKYYQKYFQSEAKTHHYSYKSGSVKIIVMNSCFENDEDQKDLQLQWVEEELKENTPFKIIAMHHPPFSKGFANNPKSPFKEHALLQKHFVPLFEKYGVNLVLAGHTHLYEHSLKDGIHYMNTGAAGGRMGIWGGKNPYSLRAEKIRTFFMIESENQNLKVKVFDELNNQVDNVEIKSLLL